MLWTVGPAVVLWCAAVLSGLIWGDFSPVTEPAFSEGSDPVSLHERALAAAIH